MKENRKKILVYFIYTLIVFFIFGFLTWLGRYDIFRQFITKIENSSFDLRQAIISKYKTPNKDIVIIDVDDASYEYIMDKVGTWPISRLAWANTVNAIEYVNPKFIIFDMLFLKPNLYDVQSDNAFAYSVAQFNNVYLSMNFDNYSDTVRKSVDLNEKFRLNVAGGALADNEYISFANVRTIMPQLMNVTKNVGSINITRDDDGVIRNVTPVFRYKNNYYPNLTLLVGLRYLQDDSVLIKNNTIVLDNSHIIPLDKTKRAILNWYHKEENNQYIYKHVPFWQVVNAMLTSDLKFLKDNFSDKIIYIGTTATSLNDIKTTPVDTNMAGVEIHATFLNNIIDNNFIKRASSKVDFIVSIILSLIVGYFVLKTTSVVKSFIILVAMLLLYLLVATYSMHLFNIWISIVIPVLSIIMTFIFVYSEKYLLKARDYEQTYKLAVTDGLTQLYNHRYFQEQMIIQVDNFKRYGNKFSLILIDIDFFKKFNDTYGHQSGDAVLKQVANILKKNVRTSDIACRYGGEEMSIILTNTAKKEAVVTANKICIAVRSHKFEVANGNKVNVTISVGVSTVNVDGNTPQEMIEYADKCLYKAKESGRNQVVYKV
ncbi:MAG: diguanylate cyclase [Candidatus Gastranaerophilales bacterium]|nr:diguanylate cyclase [Candidatus Gastranaerophilales bacterium]